MPGLSKVIVLDPDVRAARQIQLGFHREGIPAEAAEVPRDPAELALPAPDAGLWIVGGTDPGALGLVRRTRELLDEAGIDAPIVFAGRGVDRAEAEDAGADEVLLQPAYLRDVVTIGRLLRGQPAARRGHLVGSLAETTAVLTLVRALAALGRSAVLTLIRGLRRGEVRFYHGEVTSAQCGLMNGQAALHQLLLWTDARFDYRYEDLVRRQQIPLDRDELYADAERFLAGVRESSGRLSPAMVIEQDVARLQSLGKQIPMEVYSILRMFDGHRVLADVLEDSPYRVFETLRVAQLALAAGLLRQAAKPRPRATWRAVLALEEWLVGIPPRDEAPEPGAAGDSGAIPRADADADAGRGDKSGPNRAKGSRRKRKKRRTSTPVAGTAAGAGATAAAPKPNAEIDWGALIPREVGAEVGALAGVVPAAHTSGEITLPAREKLEELTDAAQRDRIFSTETTVFWDDAAEPEARASGEVAQLEASLADARETTRIRLPFPAARATAAASTPPAAAAAAAAPVAAVPEPVAAEPPAPPAPVAAVPEPVAAEPPAPPAPVAAVPEPVAAEPPAPPAPVPAVPEPEPAVAPESESTVTPEPAAAAPNEPAAATTPSKLDAPPPAVETPEERARRDAEETAALEAMYRAEAEAAARAQAAAEPSAAAAPEPPATPAEPAPASAEPAAASAEPPAAPAEPAPASAEPPAATAEPPAASAELPAAAAEPAVGSAAPPAGAPEDEPPAAAAQPEPPAAPAAPPVQLPPVHVDLTSGAPTIELIDETSDGIIRQTLATAETAPSPRRPPSEIPVDDRPEDTTGEIVTTTGQRPAVQPPLDAEPSILVADLAEVHTAVAAVATSQAAAPPPPSMATPATEQAVAEISDDAAGTFSDTEEDFFRAGQDKRPSGTHETFEDLDKDYKPVGFWDRLLGRKPKR